MHLTESNHKQHKVQNVKENILEIGLNDTDDVTRSS